jgi:hypothetical protein
MSTTAGSVYFTGRNFKATTGTTDSAVNANNMTLNVGTTTIPTIHARVVADTQGNLPVFQITYTSNLPAGRVSVGFNGTSYNWTNANLQPTSALRVLQDAASGNARLANRGVILTTSTVAFIEVVSNNADGTFRPLRDLAFIFALGFTASTAATATYTPTNGAAAALLINGGATAAGSTDANGAGLFWTTTTAGGSTTAAIPRSYGANNIISLIAGTTGTTTITATANMWFPSTAGGANIASGSVEFQGATRFNERRGLEVTGFRETSASVVDSSFAITLTNTATAVVTTWTTVTTECTTAVAFTSATSGLVLTAGATAPCYTRFGAGDYGFSLPVWQTEIAGGTYTLTVQGTTTGNVATASITISPQVFGAALSNAVDVRAGDTLAIISTTTVGTQGVHGLLPNTAYSIKFGGGSNATTVGSFTSTAQGLIPAGTQFVVPSGVSGRQIIDIVNPTTGESAIYGNIIPRDHGISQFRGAAASTDVRVTTAQAATGLTILLTGRITLNPTVGTVGSVVSVSAQGLQPDKAYYVVLPNGIAYASATSTSTGSIINMNFTWPAIATTASNEQGLSQTVCISSTASTGNCDGGTGTFVLQASATLSPTGGPAGSSVSLTAKGLASGQAYNIVWDYAVVAATGNTFTGTVVGGLSGGTDGNAIVTFTVPSTAAAGLHSIELARTGCGAATTCVALVSPLTFNVGGTVGQGCTGTGCFTSTTGPSTTMISGQTFVTITYTNNGNTTITGIVYAVVHNSLGQTVQYTTGTITPAAGASAEAFLALAGLPTGTYTVTVFVITTSGTAISTTSTVSVTFS